MQLFQCQCCGQVLHFENTTCLRCGRPVGYLPGANRMVAVEADGSVWHAARAEAGPATLPQETALRFCRNWELTGCNWMLLAPEGDEAAAGGYCRACRHNRTVPDLTDPLHHARWQKIETAKRRLFYSLLRLGLPLPLPGSGHPEPLVFDFLADDPGAARRVMTGHSGGVVTIALSEADDAAREATRARMGEAYRTLLGHFRHEIGHYYWDLLVRGGGAISAFRAVFGDETQDYHAALDRHYGGPPPAGWEGTHVSAYATVHPWEDWAETWAHYLHMVDTLETAAAFGMTIDPPADGDGELSAEIDFNPYRTRRLSRLIAAWMPLTVALNALARSVGQGDLYPFVLPAPVLEKLGFVHGLVAVTRAQA
ncbi:MAG: putative zinc-binding metallopeptidase [Rhodobacteraceae bacterium]|nr:putative zinc-binding metallopeptidase [Paracoccaceae bacterium]